ncbi:MAG: alpha-glucan family phosphorylase, partial [Candidatus Sumerlaeota bacterium]|nr:alpha-glucan family phosphorylase [Candidatus Sumerlaeota bacterium]
MKPIRTYTVRPRLPERLARLAEIATTLWYEWDHDARALFLRVDRDLWERSGMNPMRMLGTLPQDTLDALAADDGFIAQYDRVCRAWDDYRAQNSWYQQQKNIPATARIAYFSLEFGLTECIPIYSGGLGILAGDHVKASSDLGLPLIGVGNLWQQGYFHQYLNNDGWQGERYPDNDFYTMPLHLERHPDDQPITIQVDYPSGPVLAQIWTIQVGRTKLVMLDTNTPLNARTEDRAISYQLYGGDIENRIRQEIMLGVGGLRALDALNLRPTVCHLNEGHSAFLTLERIRAAMAEQGLAFDEAREASCAGNVFTTHTCVPAGNETFPAPLVERYVHALFKGMDVPMNKILSLGRINPHDHGEGFGMTVFAIRMSSYVNGVSRLHGQVTRDMWKNLWPQTPVEDVPISELLNRYLDPDWRRTASDLEIWKAIERIPNDELWRVHELRRERLVTFARHHLKTSLLKRRASAKEIALVDEILDPSALTIVFARRFATYKRGALLMRDLARLRKLLCDAERPVQIIYTGKAHPHDTPGKEVIRQIVHVAHQEEFHRQIIFLEDYDLQIARYLAQGADVWLNTPRRPLEASGTSGMKAAVNGALNVSILDGWYDEAHRHNPEIGWAIGAGERYDDHDYQDEVECGALYNILEQDVVPTFYHRGRDGAPREWIKRMKAAMIEACAVYNTERMTREYAERFYFPSARRYQAFNENNFARAKRLSQWRERTRERWNRIRIEDTMTDQAGDSGVGAVFSVRARVFLGNLAPEEVLVEIYHGEVDAAGEIQNSRRIAMVCDGPSRRDGKSEPGMFLFIGTIDAPISGHFGYSVRVLPKHEDLVTPFEPEMIVWASKSA